MVCGIVLCKVLNEFLLGTNLFLVLCLCLKLTQDWLSMCVHLTSILLSSPDMCSMFVLMCRNSCSLVWAGCRKRYL